MPKTLKKRQNEPELHFQPDQNYISKIEIANLPDFLTNLPPQKPFSRRNEPQFSPPKKPGKIIPHFEGVFSGIFFIQSRKGAHLKIVRK